MSVCSFRRSPRATAARVAALGLYASLVLAASPGSAADSVEALVGPFLESVKGKLGAPGAEDGYRVPVRAILEQVESQAAARSAALMQRRQELRDASEALVSGLAQEIGTENGRARAQVLVEKAAKEHRQARIDGLERSIICWCPDESWTRTLSGCAQGCAEEQKGLIRAWIDEGATDSEIIDRMVAHAKGGPKVRAIPEAKGANWIGYLGPGILTVAGAVIVALLLRRTRRRGGPSTRTAARSAAAEDDIGEQIERELREMEG